MGFRCKEHIFDPPWSIEVSVEHQFLISVESYNLIISNLNSYRMGSIFVSYIYIYIYQISNSTKSRELLPISIYTRCMYILYTFIYVVYSSNINIDQNQKREEVFILG